MRRSDMNIETVGMVVVVIVTWIIREHQKGRKS